MFSLSVIIEHNERHILSGCLLSLSQEVKLLVTLSSCQSIFLELHSIHFRSDLNLYAHIAEALIGMPLDYLLANCI